MERARRNVLTLVLYALVGLSLAQRSCGVDKAPVTCVERPQELAPLGAVRGVLGLRRNVSLLWPPLQPLYYGAWQKALEGGRVLKGQHWVSLAGSLFNQE